MNKLKVLSLAWKYHPSITSGVGVACDGLNNALSKIVDLTVIHPSISKIQVEEEVLLTAEDLTEQQWQKIYEEYITLIEKGHFELAVPLDPYYVSKSQVETEEVYEDKQIIIKTEKGKNRVKKEIKTKQITEKLQYNDVDIFGENVRDKVFLYNRLVEELANNIQFDIIHAHDWMTFLAGIHLKDRFKKPLILHVHSLEYDRVGHKDVAWVYDIERFAMSKANAVIAVSDYTKGIIESNYGLYSKNIHTIYNAFSIPAPIKTKIPKLEGQNKILFAGRIHENKGLQYFIEIAREILNTREDMSFVVVGRGLHNIKMEEVDGFAEIADKFQYLGFVEREELFSLYKQCDVLCMPSVSEPFGLTALEAAYMGLPVILSTRSGVSEILNSTPKANFWDTRKFSKEIISLLADKKKRQKVIDRNKKKVSKLSWEKSAHEVVKLYGNVIG